MSDAVAEEGPIARFFDEHPEILEAADFASDDEELAELVGVLGRELPAELDELLRLTDGGVLHGPHTTVHLATVDQLLHWVQEGLMEELETIPFAHGDGNTLLAMDPAGRWGAEGALYRIRWGRRTVAGYPVQDAVRVADSLRDLLEHIAQGRDAW